MKKEIRNGIYYIGADDRELDLFEGQYETPEGISYNSHVIVDEKIAVLDTIDGRKAEEWKQNLAEVLDGREPDYLVVSHIEISAIQKRLFLIKSDKILPHSVLPLHPVGDPGKILL